MNPPETMATAAPPLIEVEVQKPARLFNKNYLLLWQGQFVSRLGNQAFNVALLFWLKHTTGSASLMGLIMMLSSIPALLLAPVGGAIADRHSRRRIIIFCDVLAGVMVLSLAFLLLLLPEATGLAVVWLFVVSISLATIASFFGPAIAAAVPDLVPRERLVGANSMGQFSEQFSLFLGQGLGGTLFRVFGAPLLFLFDGLTFLFSAVSESFITIPQPQRQASVDWRERLRQFRRDLAEGLRYVWQTAGLKGLVLISAFNNFFSVPILLLLPFYIEDHLKAPVDWYGFLLAGFGVGSLLGYLFAGISKFAGKRRARMMIAAMLLDAGLYGLLALVHRPAEALALAVLSGAAGGFFVVNTTALLQLTTPSEIRGRLFGLLSTISGSLTPIALGLSGLVADLTGKNIPLIYLGCSAMLLLLAATAAGRRQIRDFLARETAAGTSDGNIPVER